MTIEPQPALPTCLLSDLLCCTFSLLFKKQKNPDTHLPAVWVFRHYTDGPLARCMQLVLLMQLRSGTSGEDTAKAAGQEKGKGNMTKNLEN